MAANKGMRRAGLETFTGLGANVWSGSYISPTEALCCVGSLCCALVYLMAILYGNAAGLESAHHVALQVTFALGVTAILSIGSFDTRMLRACEQSTAVLTACGVIGALTACGLTFVPHAPQVVQFGLVVALGLLMAFAWSLLLAHMGCLSGRLYIPDAASCVIAATFLALLVYLFGVAWIPVPWRAMACAVFPLLIILTNSVSILEWPTGLDFDTWTTFYDRRAEWPLFLYKVALPFFCIGVVMVALLNHLQAFVIPDNTLPATLGVLISVAAAYLVLTSAIAGIRRHVQSYSRLFAMLVPLVSLIAIPIYSAADSSAATVDLTVLIALCVISAFAWIFLTATSLEYLLSPLSIFSLGLGSLTLGALAASPLLVLFGSNDAWFFPAMALTCLLMCLGFIPANPAKNLAYSAYGTLCTKCAGVCAANMEERSATCDPAGDDAAEKPVFVTTAPLVAPGSAGDDHVRVLPADAQAGDLEHDGASGLGKGRFIRRCEHVSDLYQLSPREHEVLILLAKGRSMNYIKEALVVSEGTAKTHIRHIYRKTNVHSRHELVELIESIDAD